MIAGLRRLVAGLVAPDRALAQDLRTARFELRSVGLARTLWLPRHWRHDPALMRGLLLTSGTPSPLTWLRRSPRPDNRITFVHLIVDRQSGKPLGLHMVKLNRERRSAHCHVAVSARDWLGRGVAEEARAAVITQVFAHAPIDRFVASIDARNLGSIFVYRLLGFAHLGTQSKTKLDAATGLRHDALDFEMTREAWSRSPFKESADVAG